MPSPQCVPASDSEEREREYFLSRLTSLDEIHVAILAMLTNSVEVQDRLRSRLGKPDVVERAHTGTCNEWAWY